LTAVVVALLGMAIDFHLGRVHVHRTNVEEAQLARAVLRLMADDLRGTIREMPVDFSAVEQLAADSLSADPDALDDLVGEETVDEAEAELTTGISQSVEPPPVPGLYGNRHELSVDVSRLPRPDQYTAVYAVGAEALRFDLPGDVKTVAYYLADDDATSTARTTSPATSVGQGRGRGLVRRSLDRAVTLWAVENGNLDALDRNAELIAPEVTGLEFRYFDGAEWHEEWNSDENNGLPVAVEMAIAIEPARKDRRRRISSSAALDSSRTESGDIIYRLLVSLPLAEPTAEEDAASTYDEDDEPEEDAAQESSPNDQERSP